MKNTNNKIIIALILVLAFMSAVYLSIQPKKSLGDIIANPYFSYGTATGVLCVKGTSTQVVATSTNRQFIRISNLSSGSMYLGLGTAAATSTGIYLNASSSIEFSQANSLFTGAIYCLTDGLTATATVETLP